MAISSTLGEERDVQLPQGTVRYRETGAGEPIIFVHGLLVNGDLWRKVVPLLSDRFRCITPDLPLGSHTVPMAADADLSPPGVAQLIVDFMDALGVDKVTLVGNDTGGAVCQLVVSAHPERVQRLVLTNCDAYENFPPWMFRYLLWLARMPGAVYLLAQSMRLRPLRRLPNAYGLLTKRPIGQEIMDGYVGPVAANAGVRRDAIKLLKSASPQQTVAAAETFGSFTRPVLLAWAPEDRFFTFAYAERLAAAFPNARIERIEDARTFVAEDQPERLAEAIASFMAETPVASGTAPADGARDG